MTDVVASQPVQLPKENLFRANLAPDFEVVREKKSDGGEGPVLHGHFARFNEWTEINSIFEGNFMERFSPGAFKKTFQENREKMRVLFQHGRDPQIGDKPLGPIRELKEDDQGGYYEVPLLDAPYVRDEILPGLQANLYGASFRFRVVREEFNQKPPKSDHNPEGLPERTVKEAQVLEFGPVTFPAYDGATAKVRSVTDEMLFRDLVRDPTRLRELVDTVAPKELAPSAAQEEGNKEENDGDSAERDGVHPIPDNILAEWNRANEALHEGQYIVAEFRIESEADGSGGAERDGAHPLTTGRIPDEEHDTAVPGEPTPLFGSHRNRTVPGLDPTPSYRFHESEPLVDNIYRSKRGKPSWRLT